MARKKHPGTSAWAKKAGGRHTFNAGHGTFVYDENEGVVTYKARGGDEEPPRGVRSLKRAKVLAGKDHDRLLKSRELKKKDEKAARLAARVAKAAAPKEPMKKPLGVIGRGDSRRRTAAESPKESKHRARLAAARAAKAAAPKKPKSAKSLKKPIAVIGRGDARRRTAAESPKESKHRARLAAARAKRRAAKGERPRAADPEFLKRTRDPRWAAAPGQGMRVRVGLAPAGQVWWDRGQPGTAEALHTTAHDLSSCANCGVRAQDGGSVGCSDCGNCPDCCECIACDGCGRNTEATCAQCEGCQDCCDRQGTCDVSEALHTSAYDDATCATCGRDADGCVCDECDCEMCSSLGHAGKGFEYLRAKTKVPRRPFKPKGLPTWDPPHYRPSLDGEVVVSAAEFAELLKGAHKRVKTDRSLVEYEISEYTAGRYEIHRSDWAAGGGFKKVAEGRSEEECLDAISARVQSDVASRKTVHVWVYNVHDDYTLDALYVPGSGGEVTCYVSRDGRPKSRRRPKKPSKKIAKGPVSPLRRSRGILPTAGQVRDFKKPRMLTGPTSEALPLAPEDRHTVQTRVDSLYTAGANREAEELERSYFPERFESLAAGGPKVSWVDLFDLAFQAAECSEEDRRRVMADRFYYYDVIVGDVLEALGVRLRVSGDRSKGMILKVSRHFSGGRGERRRDLLSEADIKLLHDLFYYGSPKDTTRALESYEINLGDARSAIHPKYLEMAREIVNQGIQGACIGEVPARDKPPRGGKKYVKGPASPLRRSRGILPTAVQVRDFKKPLLLTGPVLNPSGWGSIEGLPVPPNEHDVSHLVQIAVNDGELYRKRTQPTLINLQQRYRDGHYDVEAAVTVWRLLADDARRAYGKSFGAEAANIFNGPVRAQAARELEAYYRGIVAGQENA